MSSTLTLGEVLAQRLHGALVAAPVSTVEEIYTHPAVAGLHSDTVRRLVDHLVADGRIAEDAHGGLTIAASAEAA